MASVFLDVKKTFDHVWHRGLLYKPIYMLGIENRVLLSKQHHLFYYPHSHTQQLQDWPLTISQCYRRHWLSTCFTSPPTFDLFHVAVNVPYVHFTIGVRRVHTAIGGTLFTLKPESDVSLKRPFSGLMIPTSRTRSLSCTSPPWVRHVWIAIKLSGESVVKTYHSIHCTSPQNIPESCIRELFRQLTRDRRSGILLIKSRYSALIPLFSHL